MKNPEVLRQRLSAVVLALVTLSVFAALQDYGPDSTLRRFFEAVVSHDQDRVFSLMARTGQNPPLTEGEKYVVAEIDSLANMGGSYHIERIRRPMDRVAEAWVRYDLPNGEQRMVSWILIRPGNRWSVDLSSTARSRVF